VDSLRISDYKSASVDAFQLCQAIDGQTHHAGLRDLQLLGKLVEFSQLGRAKAERAHFFGWGHVQEMLGPQT
jgi:hypothetical protein